MPTDDDTAGGPGDPLPAGDGPRNAPGGAHPSGGVPADAGILGRFRAGVEASGSRYVEVAGWEGVAAHVRGLGDLAVLPPTLAAERPDLAGVLEAAGVRVVVPTDDDPVAEVADAPVGISRARLGIAETGSLLVDEHALADRVVTMLCRRLVHVVASRDVAERLESAAAWLAARGGQAGFVSLQTGPSRTADIERSLSIGVQGPEEVDVVVLIDDAATAPTVAGGDAAATGVASTAAVAAAG